MLEYGGHPAEVLVAHGAAGPGGTMPAAGKEGCAGRFHLGGGGGGGDGAPRLCHQGADGGLGAAPGESGQASDEGRSRELWCEMNAVTLEILAETDGVDAAEAAAARAELGDGERLGGDVLKTLRAYSFSPQGRDLYEAGHVTGCREVAVGQDPFKWDKSSRRLAFLGVGVEADDKACYPRARMAMMEIGRRDRPKCL